MELSSKTVASIDLIALSQLQQSLMRTAAKCVSAEDKDTSSQGKSETQHRLIEMHGEIEAMGRVLQKYLDPEHVPHNPTPSTRVAISMVLETTELVEEILSQTGPKELLVVQQVNRKMRDVAQSSTRLQRQMVLQPRKQAGPLGSRRLETHSSAVSFLTLVRPGVEKEPEGMSMKMTARVELHPQGLLRLGGRARQVQLCYPPITSMYIYPSCCCEYSDINNPHPRFSAPWEKNDGINLGDVLDAAEILRERHVLCWDRPHRHVNVAFEPPSVRYRGEVKLAEDDPGVIEAFEAAGEAEGRQQATSSA